MLSFSISFGNEIVYSVISLLNSGEIVPSAISSFASFELLDFFASAGFVVLPDGFVVVLLFEGFVVLLSDGVVGCVGVSGSAGFGAVTVTVQLFEPVTSFSSVSVTSVAVIFIVAVPAPFAVIVIDELLLSSHTDEGFTVTTLEFDELILNCPAHPVALTVIVFASPVAYNISQKRCKS